jgi:hypothetical protein
MCAPLKKSAQKTVVNFFYFILHFQWLADSLRRYRGTSLLQKEVLASITCFMGKYHIPLQKLGRTADAAQNPLRNEGDSLTLA